MIDIINFDQAPTTRAVYYEGNAGAKEAIVFNDNVWMIKYPKSTRDLKKPQISYTTSPLSEYLGSKIYELLNIPVHETLLGIRKGKIVVACKDFTLKRDRHMWIEIGKLIPFHALKNSFMSSDLEAYSGTGSETLLGEVLDTINGHDELNATEDALKRFWDMFVIDAFIGNNDRNNGNWGLLWNPIKNTMSLAPVYDNGNAFFNKRSLAQMESRLADAALMEEDACKTLISAYRYTGLDNEGHSINPFQFIQSGENEDCKKAVERFLQNIDFSKIVELINAVPESNGTLAVMPQVQKDFYIKLMEIRLEKLRKGGLHIGQP